jgi:tetratricopeptide (TPR) repeat protein
LGLSVIIHHPRSQIDITEIADVMSVVLPTFQPITMAVFAALLSLLSLSAVSAFSPLKHRSYPYQRQSFACHGIAELVAGDLQWNSLVGEADRAFRLGVQLEKNGQASKASAAFHESTTLYQCFLDSKSEFRHVTSLSEEDIPTILAYASLRLGFLTLDALGDAKAAVRLYKEATLTDPVPSAVSYHMVGQSIEASDAGRNLNEAIAAYRQSLSLNKNDRRVLFHLAVALERNGEKDESNEIIELLRRDESVFSCLVDSWGYVRWHTRKVPNEDLNVYRGVRDMLELALGAAMPLIQEGGLVCEFGVGSGRSFRMMQEILPLSVQLHGFDTFTGEYNGFTNSLHGPFID